MCTLEVWFQKFQSLVGFVLRVILIIFANGVGDSVPIVSESIVLEDVARDGMEWIKRNINGMDKTKYHSLFFLGSKDGFIQLAQMLSHSKC